MGLRARDFPPEALVKATTKIPLSLDLAIKEIYFLAVAMTIARRSQLYSQYAN